MERPVAGEDLEGLSPEQQVEGLSHLRVHLPPEKVIEMRHGPAAVFETAGGVFLGPAGRLHDAIQRDERQNKDLSHPGSPSLVYSIRR